MKRLHQSHPIFYLASLFFGYAVALINGFRMPNLWSINYYIPSMLEGFYRRSLMGNITFFLGDLRFQYHTIALIQLLIFIALNIVIIRTCLKSDTSLKWIWLLFLLSPAGGYLFNEVGYIEQLLFLVLFLAINSNTKIISGILIIASIWIHEMALFTTIPLYLAYLIMQKRSWKEIIFVAAGSTLLFLTIYIFFQTIPLDKLQQYLNTASHSTNYEVRVDYYNVFSNQFMGERFQWYYSTREVANILLISPLWIIIAIGFAHISHPPLHQKSLFFIGFITCSLPLLLGLFGWDVHRWIFLSLCSTVLCMYWVEHKIPLLLIRIFMVVLIIFSIWGNLEYFDGFSPRLKSWQSAVWFIRNGFYETVSSIPKH